MSPAPFPHRTRRPIVARVLLVAASVVLVGACGMDDSGTVTIGKSSSATTTTVAPDSGTDPLTTDGGDGDPTTTSGGDSTTGGGIEGGGDAGAGESTGAADQDAIDVSWTSSPGEFRGQDGLRVAYACPAGGTIASLWGTGPFTDDSSVCTAGVFLGLITPEAGGRIVIEIAPGAESYQGAEAHGVTAAEYGTWAGSFEVIASDG